MKVGESVRVPKSACTNCGYVIDGAACVGEDKARPRPGDITLCLYCGHIMVYGDSLKLRDPIGQEIIDIAGDRRLLAVQRARARIGPPPKK